MPTAYLMAVNLARTSASPRKAQGKNFCKVGAGRGTLQFDIQVLGIVKCCNDVHKQSKHQLIQIWSC